MGRLPYTREKLEIIVLKQLDRIETLSDLIRETREQIDLVIEINKQLREELEFIKGKVKPYATRKK